MHYHRSAALSALISLALVGCATAPANQRMNRDIAAAVQPLDVKVGIQQAELYATMAPSRSRGNGAVACAAVPGVGILFAAVCAGVAGAVDASFDAKRFKAANDKAQPLKEALVDIQFDELMNSAVAKSLQTIPGMQVTGVSVTKTVNDQAYEQSFRASNANSVMFVTVDYHITGDFTTLNISARGMLYPRSAAARVAAGLPEALPEGKHPLLALQNSAYRTNLFYHLQLPVKAAKPAENIAAWKADGARLLHLGLQNGTAEIARLLAEDMQRSPETKKAVLPTVQIAPGVIADLIAERNDGKLVRYPDGSLHFQASPLALTTQVITPVVSVAATPVADSLAP